MPPPTPVAPSASRLRPVHLLRALLREATYLPDAPARTYFRRYIVSRFKAYQPKQSATASFDVQAVERYRHRSFKRRKIAVINERTRPLLKKGQKGLNFLRRANLGERECLLTTLFFTYGRMGRRKYLLLEGLLRPDPLMGDDAAPSPPHPQGPSPLQKLYHSDKRYLQFFDAPKPKSSTEYSIGISDQYSRLRTVVKTQHAKGISISRQLKRADMVTSIRNVWERPMPIRRARNNVKRWYAETMTRLMPPLPHDEWDLLSAMAAGQKKVSFAKRRTRVGASDAASPTDEQSAWELLEAGLAMDRPSRADRPMGMHRPHNITTKFMRRLYSRVFALSCKLEYDDERKQWNAIWGESKNTITPKIYSVPTDASLFEGVDNAGRLPISPKKVHTQPGLRPRDAHGDLVRFPFYADYLPVEHPLRKSLDEWKEKRDTFAAGSAVGGEQRRP
ncbi:hypothetical protein T440DRAFT_122228 [Plenodomus tracheiphilus IPT5]|uniref:LYR motif-containing protein Cup1-like N-terminal domain-containing protein n=1 Tax=Plenodomus tracheiphilus IPT5 TaxID=1408161 RepID=A0A6A7B353_9PLEO|nr:hypothetical protein T440DRAFT_122228 [Plenodomus tracheiphilus IPT5]